MHTSQAPAAANIVPAPAPAPFLDPLVPFSHDPNAAYHLPDVGAVPPLEPRTNPNASGDRKPMASASGKPFHLVNSTRLYDEF